MEQFVQPQENLQLQDDANVFAQPINDADAPHIVAPDPQIQAMDNVVVPQEVAVVAQENVGANQEVF